MAKRGTIETKIAEFVETADVQQVSAVLRMAQALLKRREARPAAMPVVETPVVKRRKPRTSKKANAGMGTTAKPSAADAQRQDEMFEQGGAQS